MDIKQHLQEMKEQMPLEWWLASGQTPTQAQLEKINSNPHKYDNRDRVPEPLLVYSDLWHELTGLEMLKIDVASYVEIFDEWKQRAFQPEHIRGAWNEAKARNIMVGHPRALTVTAKGVMANSKPTGVSVNQAAIAKTQEFIQERVRDEGSYVPMPDDVRARLRAKLKGTK